MKWKHLKLWVIKRKWQLGILAALLIAYYFMLPRKLFLSPTSFVLEDSKGELLGATIAADGQWRFPADKQVPDKFA